MRMIFVIMTAFIIGVFLSRLGYASEICVGKAQLIEFKTLINGPKKCMATTYKRMVEIGKEIDACDKLNRSLNRLNASNGKYKPIGLDEWLAFNDLDNLPTLRDYIKEINVWHKRECK